MDANLITNILDGSDDESMDPNMTFESAHHPNMTSESARDPNLPVDSVTSVTPSPAVTSVSAKASGAPAFPLLHDPSPSASMPAVYTNATAKVSGTASEQPEDPSPSTAQGTPLQTGLSDPQGTS